MTLESRLNVLGDRIRLLVALLVEHGFQFQDSDAILPGPETGTAEAIAQIEREVGKLPLAIKLFWGNIGGVDLRGSRPGWSGCDYPDPLVVYPPSVAILELEDFLSDKDQRLRSSFPYLIPIAPDLYHKADESGGMWYNLSVPTVADDPPLNDEWHHTTFVSYLEEAVIWAGFPGLSRCPGHSWPVAELMRGIGVSKQS